MNSARTTTRILVAEEEHGSRNLISLALKHQGYSADFLDNTAEAGARLGADTQYAALLVNLGMAAARELVQQARKLPYALPVIGLVDRFCEEGDRACADQIVEKPITGERLRLALNNCIGAAVPEKECAGEMAAPGAMAATSSLWLTEMMPIIRQVAGSDVPVLIQGETGSGKEVLGRQIHSLSQRSKKPFLKVNCAALPSELIESELFGYERGAFTGAFKTTPGKFEMANGGTILLDEIGDMDFKLQSKLLQVLQDGEFIRLGSSEPRRVNVRVMAATHCDLERAIAEGRFREDLYYRLNVVTLRVPPLRERPDEILPLSHFFMRKYATATCPVIPIPPVLRDALLAHDWPGNVRELENVIRKLLVVRRPELIAEEMRHRRTRRASAAVGSREPAAAPGKAAEAAAAAGPGVLAAASNGLITLPAAQQPNGCEQPPAREGSRNGITAVRRRPAEDVSWSILDRVDQARREAETEAILQALNATLWNRKRAAEILNIDYKALLYKMKKLDIIERAAKVAI